MTKPQVLVVGAFSFFFRLLLYVSAFHEVPQKVWTVCDRCVLFLCVLDEEEALPWGCEGDMKSPPPPPVKAAMLGVTAQVSGHPLQLP